MVAFPQLKESHVPQSINVIPSEFWKYFSLMILDLFSSPVPSPHLILIHSFLLTFPPDPIPCLHLPLITIVFSLLSEIQASS